MVYKSTHSPRKQIEFLLMLYILQIYLITFMKVHLRVIDTICVIIVLPLGHSCIGLNLHVGMGTFLVLVCSLWAENANLHLEQFGVLTSWFLLYLWVNARNTNMLCEILNNDVLLTFCVSIYWYVCLVNIWLIVWHALDHIFCINELTWSVFLTLHL